MIVIQDEFSQVLVNDDIGDTTVVISDTGERGPQGPTGSVEGVSYAKADRTGFPVDGFSNYQCDILYNETTRTVSLVPTDGISFDIWVSGTAYTFTGTQTVVHDDTYGRHFIYFNASGALTYTQTAWSIMLHAPACEVFWDDVGKKAIVFDERHHAGRDLYWHINQHLAEGTKALSGFAASNYTLDEGNADASLKLAIATGRLADEDITVNTEALVSGNYTIVYKEGASGNWRITRDNSLPVLTDINGVVYNTITSGSWALQSVPNYKSINYWAFGVTSLLSSKFTPALTSSPHLVLIAGHNLYDTSIEASSEVPGNLDWGPLPFAEMVPLYQLTAYKNDQAPDNFTNTAKAAFHYVTRMIGTIRNLANSSVSMHRSLGELSNDDHAQYALADGTRGNFEAIGSVSAHELDVNPHSQYLTGTDAANTYRPLGNISPSDLDADNSPIDMSLVSYDITTGKFEWLSSTYYQPAQLNMIVGSVDSGSITGTYTKGDGSQIIISEIASVVPGFDVRFVFDNVDTFNLIKLYMRYSGGHSCVIQLWKPGTTAWVDISAFNNQNGLVDINITVDNYLDYIDGIGSVILRLYHPATGVGTHKLYLDYVSLVNAVSGGGGISNHQALGGRSEPEAHPAASVKYTPHGLISVEDVQLAINYLEDNKLNSNSFSGLAKITVSSTEPVSPSNGDLWIETN